MVTPTVHEQDVGRVLILCNGVESSVGVCGDSSGAQGVRTIPHPEQGLRGYGPAAVTTHGWDDRLGFQWPLLRSEEPRLNSSHTLASRMPSSA